MLGAMTSPGALLPDPDHADGTHLSRRRVRVALQGLAPIQTSLGCGFPLWFPGRHVGAGFLAWRIRAGVWGRGSERATYLSQLPRPQVSLGSGRVDIVEGVAQAALAHAGHR